jgi:6-phosphogluconolactonase/glucosamine-6-phosphate isomerase/deaminase
MAPIHVVPARDELNIEQKLVTLILAAVQEKPDLIISVFAGTPAFGPYRVLVERARAELVDFTRVRFVVFDELIGATTAGAVAPFRAVLDERLFVPLAIPPENILSFDPSKDAAAEAARIEGQLGVTGIDIALLPWTPGAISGFT